MTADPPRWSEAGSGAPPGLSALLRDGHADVPSSSELDAMFARLGPKLAPLPAATALHRSPWARIGAVLGVLAVVGAGIVIVRAVNAPANAPAELPSAPAVTPLPSPAPPPAPQASLESEVNAPSTPAPSTPTPPPTPETKSRAAPKLGEAELLEAARRALATDPTRALRLAEQHKARFPSGILQQEREVIAIEALRKLGRSNAATNRAEKFEDKFPDSAHRRGVEAGQRKP